MSAYKVEITYNLDTRNPIFGANLQSFKLRQMSPLEGMQLHGICCVVVVQSKFLRKPLPFEHWLPLQRPVTSILHEN